jgi:hypothetical protein
MTSPDDTFEERFLSTAARERVQQTIAELSEWLGSRLSVAQSVREQHGPVTAKPPDARILPMQSHGQKTPKR